MERVMEEEFKKEYYLLLDEIEKIFIKINALDDKTRLLKEKYNKNPDDANLLEEIVQHEKTYKEYYEKMKILNKKAKILKEKFE